MELSDSILLIGIIISYAICFALSSFLKRIDPELDGTNFWFLTLMSLTLFFKIWITGGLLFLLLKLILNFPDYLFKII